MFRRSHTNRMIGQHFFPLGGFPKFCCVQLGVTTRPNRTSLGVWGDYTPATLIGWDKEGLNGQQMEVAGVESRKVGAAAW